MNTLAIYIAVSYSLLSMFGKSILQRFVYNPMVKKKRKDTIY